MLDLRVKKTLSQVFNISTESICENTSPDTVKKWDSLGHMNLIVALEEEFNVTFNETQIVEMISYPLILLTLEEANYK